MEKNGIRFSLKLKMHIFVIFTVLAVALGTSITAFFVSANQIDNYYKQAASGNARNVAAMIDGDFIKEFRPLIETEEYQAIREKAEEEENEQPIEDFMREHGVWEKYSGIRTMISEYLGNMDGIKYLYIVAHGDKNADHDMYLISDDSSPITEVGYYEERETELLGIDLTALPEPTISNGDWGWLCSDFKPVYASDGSVPCIVGCDFEMDEVMAERQRFLIYLIGGALGLTLIVQVFALIFINKSVVRPLDAMTKEMKKFNPAANVSYDEAGVIGLNIRTHDEIGEIYEGIRTMQINTIDRLNLLSKLEKDKAQAEKDIEDKERQIGQLSKESYKDALTGVGNKAAYFKKVEELNREIAEGEVEFAIVMVDMNNLKQVNDEHGHKAGDLYIKGCCRMVCEAFKHSPVFRIGGDEFVVLLQGQDYENRRRIFDKLSDDFEKCYSRTDNDQWLRYSAALGMAENASDDATVDLVFRRADKAMYEHKMKFKSEHGSYR
jgi:diguanylate cyclase (GGDEF)-like protein